MTPKFHKFRSLPLEQHLFTQKLQTALQIGLSILNPNLSEIDFVGEKQAEEKLQNSILQATYKLIYSWRMETTLAIS